MTAARALVGPALIALALGTAACGGDDAPAPERPRPEPPGTGYFVGTGPAGIGATLDLEGRDPVTAAVDRALRARDGTVGAGPVVGIASVVNEGPRPLPAPSFAALFPDGGAAPLRDAARVVAAGPRGAAAAEALRALGRPPLFVPAGGAVTQYVVLRGAAPGEVGSVRMTVVPGRPVTLRERPR